MLANGPISFKVSLHSLTAQFTMEVELVAAALTITEVVFCSNIMVELGFKKEFSSVPVYLDNISTLHVTGNRTYSAWAKYVALRYYFTKELVEGARSRPTT